MTADLAALRALHDAVKHERLTTAMCEAFFQPRHEHWDEDPAYHMVSAQMGSLDAAHALHKAVLPGWDFSVGAGPIQGVNGFAYLTGWQQGETDAEADTPARAWLLAILAAIIAQQEGE